MMPPTIRVLFLDDMDHRHQAVRTYFGKRPDFKIDHVYTARQACKALGARHYDLVCLDHDLPLSHEMLVGVPYETGQVVTDYITTLPDGRLPAWVHVHSQNEAGTKRMVNALEAGGLTVTSMPFEPTRLYWDRISSTALHLFR